MDYIIMKTEILYGQFKKNFRKTLKTEKKIIGRFLIMVL